MITRINILLAKNHITVIWNTAKRTLALEWLIQYRCIYYFTQISIFCKEYIALQFTWKFYSKSNILNVSGIYLKYISNLETEISQNSKINYQVQIFCIALSCTPIKNVCNLKARYASASKNWQHPISWPWTITFIISIIYEIHASVLSPDSSVNPLTCVQPGLISV